MKRPSAIRADIIAACPKATEIGNRHEAIRYGISLLGEADILLVAGKGHEDYQLVGDETLPFSDNATNTSDHQHVTDGGRVIMWSVAEIMNATHGRATGRMDWTARNIAIDSRKVTDGDLFIALKGDHYDGHDYIDAAFKGGAVAALSQHPVPEKHNAIIVNNTMDGLCDLAVAARERTHDHRIAITGSVGKTGTKNLVADVLTSYGKTHSSQWQL